MENNTYTISNLVSPYIDDYTISVLVHHYDQLRVRCMIQTLELINKNLKNIEMEMTLTVSREDRIERKMVKEVYLMTKNKVYDMMSRSAFKDVQKLDDYLMQFYRFTLAL